MQKSVLDTPIRIQNFLVVSLTLLFFSTSTALRADTVNAGNISSFLDGQPAVAGQVNGNFQELITQINDNAARVAALENTGIGGENDANVNCAANADGPDAIQEAVQSTASLAGRLTIIATGVCNSLFIVDRDVVIVGNGLTINGNGSSPAVFIERADVELIEGSSPIIVEGNGSVQALTVTTNATLFLFGVNVRGASAENIAGFQDAQVVFLGNNVIGSAADGVTGLRLEQSLALHFATASVSASNLQINSSGRALFLDSSIYEVFRLGAGKPMLTVASAADIMMAGNSRANLGPANITTTTPATQTGAGLNVVDNSSLTFDGSLLDSGDSVVINGDISVNRNSTLHIDLPASSSTNVDVTHTGTLLSFYNSVFMADGIANDPTSILMTSGGTVGTGFGGIAEFKSVTIGASSMSSQTGSYISLFLGTVFSGSQPEIRTEFGGRIVEGGNTALNSTITDCDPAGIALQGPTDRCPP